MAKRFKTPGDAARLGARIRVVRQELGLTLQEVEAQVGIDAGQISKIERGLMSTFSKNVQKLCELLEVSEAVGGLRPTHAGRMVDELIASLPGSEHAVAMLVHAIKEVITAVAASAEGSTGHRAEGSVER